MTPLVGYVYYGVTRTSTTHSTLHGIQYSGVQYYVRTTMYYTNVLTTPTLHYEMMAISMITGIMTYGCTHPDHHHHRCSS